MLSFSKVRDSDLMISREGDFLEVAIMNGEALRERFAIIDLEHTMRSYFEKLSEGKISIQYVAPKEVFRIWVRGSGHLRSAS